MAPFNVDKEPQEGGPLSLELIIVITGCSALFVLIVVVFCLVARKKCCARTPACDFKHVHNYVAHRGSPIASVDRSKCPRCFSDRRLARQTGSVDTTSAHLPTPY